MASSKIADKVSRDNSSKKYVESKEAYRAKRKAIYDKYKDRGTSGKKQMEKEIAALTKNYIKESDKNTDKILEDVRNVARYGKDAMKGKSFAK